MRRPLLLLCGAALLSGSALLPGAGAPGEAAPPAKAAHARPQVILVGWDGADWKLLDPLMQRGLLPNLSALVARGRTWNLSTVNPMISPLIWTTLATGRTPVDHGVADFQELDPKTGARLPISGWSRKVPAVWNVASDRGLKVGVVGWWATWPAEKVNGFFVSDRASPVLFPSEVLNASPALTWPDGLADGVRLVGRRDGTPGFDEVSRALKVTRAEFDAVVSAGNGLSDPVTGYQKILGSTRVYARTALELYDRGKPDLLMVYFEGTDEIGHLLARYTPPKLPNISDDDFRKYAGGVVAYFQEADRILGEFMKRAENAGGNLVLVSDHGFKWGADRPSFASSIQFDTAFLWHESPGILAAEGPAFPPAAARGKAGIFDVAPTLCRLLGLPADPAFEGKPVAGLSAARVPAAPPAVSWTKTFKVERLAVRSSSSEADQKAGEEFTKKLISLGYLTGAEAAAVDARPPGRTGTETVGTFQNIATFLRARGEVKEALPWYRKALEVNPKAPTALFNYSVALQILNRWDESDEALIAALKNGYHAPEAGVYRRVASYAERGGKDPKSRLQLVTFLRKAVDAFPENLGYRASLGKALFEAKDCAAAQTIFRDLSARNPRDTDALNLMALASWCLGDLADARDYFTRSLAVDPNQPPVRNGLVELARASGGNHAAPPR
jgi:predicted AlkP superfamily phosphohydrolase/phosphomutase/Tfp pilus assembly protein PilF